MARKFEHQNSLALLFMGCILLAMLLASLWWRFTEPSLTVRRFGGQKQEEAVKTTGSDMAAIGQLMEMAAKNPHDVPLLLRLTESLMAVGQWESAENFAQRALNESPGGNPTAMYLLAVVHHNQGKHAEAAELLEKLLARQENPSARYSLAILYIHFLNKPEAGREQLQKGINDDNAPQPLIDAMQEELGKLPAIPQTIPLDSSSPETQPEIPAQSESEQVTGAQGNASKGVD